jgi:rhamnose utilization protein RhaD (predicted bifunctional aldolase and dehydrogenase)
MPESMSDLIEISRFYGANKDFVIAGGGNTSYKDEERIYIKASGVFLATIDEEGFAVLDRQKVHEILDLEYDEDPKNREDQIKTNLMATSIDANCGKRPSVETSLHEMIPYPFVVHTHPTLVNALLCSQKAEEKVKSLFGTDVLFVEYTDPGFTLAKVVQKRLEEYMKSHSEAPSLIFLQNHGIFVSGNTTAEIKNLYQKVISSIEKQIKKQIKVESLPKSTQTEQILQDLPSLLGDEMAICTIHHNTLNAKFYMDPKAFQKIASVFTPDMTMFCKCAPLYIQHTTNIQTTLTKLEEGLEQYEKKNSYMPKVIMLNKIGVITVDQNNKAAEIVQDVFEDAMKISLYSEHFGGPHFLDQRAIDFIEDWEVEQYRRKLACENEKEA